MWLPVIFFWWFLQFYSFNPETFICASMESIILGWKHHQTNQISCIPPLKNIEKERNLPAIAGHCRVQTNQSCCTHRPRASLRFCLMSLGLAGLTGRGSLAEQTSMAVSNAAQDTLWLFNSLPWKPWPIGIDGLPIKNGDFPWQTVK